MSTFATDLAALQSIPTPVAPARPTLNTMPVNYNGQSVTLDQFGNMLNASGNSVGVIPGSVADVGTGGTTTAPATTSTTTASSSDGVFAGILNSLANKAGLPMVTSASSASSFLSSHLEDAVVIIVGLILIAAGLFAFKTTQTVINTASKIGSKAVELAG